MADAIAEFFEGAAARGPQPQLEKATGTVRLDVKDGKRLERWFVSVKNGDVKVSRKNAPADVVIRGERPLFERLFTGRANAMAALLRGELTIEGFDPQFLAQFQRLLPRPQDRRRSTPRRAGRANRR